MGDGLLPSGITSDPEYYKVKNIIVVIDATRDAADMIWLDPPYKVPV